MSEAVDTCFNAICLYLLGRSQLMPSEKVKSPGNRIMPFARRHDTVPPGRVRPRAPRA